MSPYHGDDIQIYISAWEEALESGAGGLGSRKRRGTILGGSGRSLSVDGGFLTDGRWRRRGR